MNVTLYRYFYSPQGVFGALVKGEQPLCLTLEDPSNNNIRGESCIPLGSYKCQKHNGAHYTNVWEVLNVPNRSAILIHNGNTSKYDTQGCILVGTKFGSLNGLPAILESGLALNMLRAILPNEFTLNITGKD